MRLGYLISLYRLAIVLKRHGAIRSLEAIEMVPGFIPTLLRIFTILVPRKRSLPDSAGERLALALSKMGPAYIKLGQTLATRPDVVTKPIAEGLTTLQDRLPAFDFKGVKATFTAEFGVPLETYFSSFSESPVAAASIAQVHKATTTDGRSVAVKVLRPGIEARFGRDIALFDWIATRLEALSSEARRLRLMDVVQKVRETTDAEMDLRLEAASADELAKNMAGESSYHVPAIDWDRTGRRVMTLEWVDGKPLSRRDALEKAGHDMTALAQRVVQIFLKQAMYDGFFHADLHQGNLLVESDGRLTAVDFGIMGRLSRDERRFLAEILFSFVRRDYQRAADVHFEAGYVPAHHDRIAFAEALKAIADPIMDLPVDQISAGKLLGQLFATTERFEMQTRPELILLQRSMVMAEGLALHLDPQSNMWDIARPVLEGWVSDHMSPEIRLADALRKLPRLIQRAPEVIEKLLDDTPTPTAASAKPTPPYRRAASERPHPLGPFLLGAASIAGLWLILG